MSDFKKEFIPLCTPNISGNESRYLQECVDTGFVSSVGPFVNRFEEEVARIAEAPGAVATSSGTTGLHSALMGLDVRLNDLVIVPSFTFIASSNSIAHCGAQPWFCEIETNGWTLDPQCLHKMLEEETKFRDGHSYHKITGQRIAAIMPIYTLGNIPQMDQIGQLAEHFNIPIVADAAAALGATLPDKSISSVAHATVFSFNGNKTVTAGAGGAVVSMDPHLLKKIKHLTTTARVGAEYDHDRIGYNYRMSNLQAAVGVAQLEKLDVFLKKKKAIRNRYDLASNHFKSFKPFPHPSWCHSSYWYSGYTVESGAGSSVAEICVKLRDRGIEARTFWKPVHLQKPFSSSLKTDLKITENLWKEVLTLPCSTHLSETDQDFVIQSLKEVLN